MCGIFGIIAKKESSIEAKEIKKIVNDLYIFSQSRGKEAAGLALNNGQEIVVYKQPIPASAMIKQKIYQAIIEKNSVLRPLCLIGHSRLVTNGNQAINTNNQPVIKDGCVGVHNGIIVNVDDLWNKFPEIKRAYEVDTEVIFSLFRKYLNEKKSIIASAQKVFTQIKGAASIAVLFNDSPNLLLATNTGSLYTGLSKNNDFLVFASEKFILKKLATKNKRHFQIKNISHLKAGEGIKIDFQNFQSVGFRLNQEYLPVLADEYLPVKIAEVENPVSENLKIFTDNQLDEKLLVSDFPEIKRCSKCILPATFPGIIFDGNGVCNFCNHYKKKSLLGEEELEKILKKYRSESDKPDCLVAFSGGRDSSYGLHLIKNKLGMNPIAFTYDWGMITDLARRNQARICGQLGIEHILISADIRKKRENIRKNISAWLKKPDLGLVPLFMAGDKQFFYYANKLMKQNDLPIMIFCENERLENTKFKTAFCGVYEGSNRWANMPVMQKIKLAAYYGKQFLVNPAYFNASLFDTIFAYLSTYFLAHDYIFLYRFLGWEENGINAVLINKYDWETAKDTNSTWRIGDGTAPFYNYIYYTAAGFTENDTFRSNQIREGIITRGEALKFIREENKPRPESIKWYADQIGFDANQAIKIINSIPKLYK